MVVVDLSAFVNPFTGMDTRLSPETEAGSRSTGHCEQVVGFGATLVVVGGIASGEQSSRTPLDTCARWSIAAKRSRGVMRRVACARAELGRSNSEQGKEDDSED